jgi:hypothetical protein
MIARAELIASFTWKFSQLRTAVLVKKISRNERGSISICIHVPGGVTVGVNPWYTHGALLVHLNSTDKGCQME